MPIQTLAMITDTSDQSGDVSQLTGPTPSAPSTLLTTPESLLSIHDQVDAETIMGSSHGTRKSARSVPDSRKLLLKNTASARPIAYWNAIDTTVKMPVWITAGQNVGSAKTSRKLSSPTNGASPETNERTV